MKNKIILSHSQTTQPLYTSNNTFKVGAEPICDLRILLPDVEDLHLIIDFENHKIEALGGCIKINSTCINKGDVVEFSAGDKIELFGVALYIGGFNDDVSINEIDVNENVQNDSVNENIKNDSFFKIDDEQKKRKIDNEFKKRRIDDEFKNQKVKINAHVNSINKSHVYALKEENLNDYASTNNDSQDDEPQVKGPMIDDSHVKSQPDNPPTNNPSSIIHSKSQTNYVSNKFQNNKSELYSNETNFICQDPNYKKESTQKKQMNEKNKSEKKQNVEVEEVSRINMPDIEFYYSKDLKEKKESLENLKDEIKNEIAQVVGEEFKIDSPDHNENKNIAFTDQEISENLKNQIEHNDIEISPPQKKDLHDVVVDKNIMEKTKDIIDGRVVEEIVETREIEITTINEVMEEEYNNLKGDKGLKEVKELKEYKELKEDKEEDKELKEDKEEDKELKEDNSVYEYQSDFNIPSIESMYDSILKESGCASIEEEIEKEIKLTKEAIQRTSEKIEKFNVSLKEEEMDFKEENFNKEKDLNEGNFNDENDFQVCEKDEVRNDRDKSIVLDRKQETDEQKIAYEKIGDMQNMDIDKNFKVDENGESKERDDEQKDGEIINKDNKSEDKEKKNRKAKEKRFKVGENEFKDGKNEFKVDENEFKVGENEFKADEKKIASPKKRGRKSKDEKMEILRKEIDGNLNQNYELENEKKDKIEKENINEPKKENIDDAQKEDIDDCHKENIHEDKTMNNDEGKNENIDDKQNENRVARRGRPKGTVKRKNQKAPTSNENKKIKK